MAPKGVIGSRGDLKVGLELNPQSFRGLMAAIKEFDPALATATRRRLRKAGEAVIPDMRARVLAGGRGPTHQAVARAIRTRVLTGKRRQGVQIQSAGGAMARMFNKPKWRHPLFGNKTVWYEQTGHPYFGNTIRGHEDELRQAVLDALGDALDAMTKAS